MTKVKKIVYTKSYVAFLDVLGFKNLVFSKSKESKEKLDSYFHYIDIIIKYLKDIPIKQDIGYIVISDSIILTVPHGKTPEENVDRLRHLCIAVGFLQIALSSQDIWIRGGISSGDTYFDNNNNQIVGPAYIESYLLEENLAIFPRVILDNKIIKELNFTNSEDLISKINKKDENGLDFENCGKTILYEWDTSKYIEKDVPLFIDYLAYCIKEDHAQDKNTLTLKIIGNIEKNIYNNTTLYKKFKWVGNYFQSTIENSNNIEIQKYLVKIKQL